MRMYRHIYRGGRGGGKGGSTHGDVKTFLNTKRTFSGHLANTRRVFGGQTWRIFGGHLTDIRRTVGGGLGGEVDFARPLKQNSWYPLVAAKGGGAVGARRSAGSGRAEAAPSMATHVRAPCQQTQRAAPAVGCAVLVLMTAVAEVATKPWCAAPTATFNAVLAIALVVDAVVAQPAFELLVWVWRWTRGDIVPTAPYPIHGAWRTAGAVSATDAASASDFFQNGFRRRGP